MSAIAAAIGGAAVIGAVSSVNAANKQSDAAWDANQTQQNQYNQTMKMNQPWIDSGKANLATLNSQMPDLTRQFSQNDFHTDPGYQFQLDQGLTAMQRSAAARGFNDSTGTLKNLNDYAQNTANSAYGAAYNRFTQSQNQRYNMLAGLANNGQIGVNQVGTAGMNMANNMSANTIGAGNAQASGIMGASNAISSGFNSGANAYMGQNMMNRFAPPPGGGSGGMMAGGPDLSGSSSLEMPTSAYSL